MSGLPPAGPDDLRGLGPPLARGGSADVFAWRPGWVLKLYREGCPEGPVRREAERTRAAGEAGAPVPAVADVVSLAGRHGIVLARAEGPTLFEQLLQQPQSAVTIAARLADLHADLHERTTAALPSQREWLTGAWAQAPSLTEAARARLDEMLDGLPDGAAICHGDFHPLNIVMAPSGPVLLDWYNATRGHPLGDVARTVLLLRLPIVPRGTRPEAHRALSAIRPAFLDAYRRRYAERRPFTPAQLDAWMLPVAAARLGKATSAAEREALLALVRSALKT
jgi:aminoglycoside phosphotransferase (APT) family kinase protein